MKIMLISPFQRDMLTLNPVLNARKPDGFVADFCKWGGSMKAAAVVLSLVMSVPVGALAQQSPILLSQAKPTPTPSGPATTPPPPAAPPAAAAGVGGLGVAGAVAAAAALAAVVAAAAAGGGSTGTTGTTGTQ